MKTICCILVLLVGPAIALATEQEPDILYYDTLQLSVSTGWGHPSPLETYYHQNRLECPFYGISTANYRGHVAIWTIHNDQFYLSKIRIEDYVRDPNGRYEWVVETYEPNEYGVKTDAGAASADGEVLADWFSGILDCYGFSGGTYSRYFFHVRDGNVVDTQTVTRQDYDILSTTTPDTWSDDLQDKYNMLVLNENYITYYYRLNEDDEIEYDEQTCRLTTGFERLSPLFDVYDSNHLNWPYNWENTEKSGAPHCHWRMEDDRLYLTGVDLYSGLSFYSIDTETLDLAALFGDSVTDGVVDANWVGGIYVIKHGYVTEEYAGWPGLTFTVFNVTEFTYIRVEAGRLTESYTVPKDFDPDNLPEDTDPGLKQLIEDYRLPSVFDPPEGSSTEEQGQAHNPPLSEDDS